MIIEFNTDHHINGTESLTAPLSALITEKLKRFADKIEKVDVHLTDEDGPKDGKNDKRCLLEAHLEGIQPVVARNHANTHEQAVAGAIDKLKAALDTTFDRLKDHS